MARIDHIAVQGFRSFGPEPQALELKSPLAVIWGPNSEGKTSLAEALEFLLTGDVARRDLLASAQDEFANALRNAHLSDAVPTFVEARITTNDGSVHVLRRTLVRDYAKRQPCESRLDLDGVLAPATVMRDLGIKLSDPPLAAPVLMPHTLGYLFSAQPKERALYFKALLEVTDLDSLRDAMKSATDLIPPPSTALLDRLARCIPLCPAILTPLADGVTTVGEIETAISEASQRLLSDAGEVAPPTLAERLARLDQLVVSRRAKTFPLHGFACATPTATWVPPAASTWTAIDDYKLRIAEIDESTRRLTALFQQVLTLPNVANAGSPVDCPICETPNALTPERVAVLQAAVASSAGLRSAEERAVAALGELAAAAQELIAGVSRTSPAFLGWSSTERRRLRFRTNLLPGLLDEALRSILQGWFGATVHLLRAKRRLQRLASSAQSRALALKRDISKLPGDTDLAQVFEALPEAVGSYTTCLEAYNRAFPPLSQPLTVAVDEKSRTVGWEDLSDLGRSAGELRTSLLDRKAHAALLAEIARACKQVDDAKELVLEEKFDQLAGDVRYWWNLLRPEEPAFFSDLGLRKGAQRTIDFKAGLAPSADRNNAKLRDAVAVFSHSQMHCLGLATFFARVAGGGDFLILDDPIISIDDDHSAHFIDAVVAALIARDVQVVILTYEQKTWRAIQERYDQGQAEAFQLNLDDPRQGTIVTKSSDSLALMLKAAEPFVRSSVLGTRKDGCQRIRDCAERFCKELLVRRRREQGDSTALVTDYSGPKGTLDSLIDEAIPYLSGSDEPGKLKMLRQLANPGNHDDDVPAKTTLAMLLGNLKALRAKYLG